MAQYDLFLFDGHGDGDSGACGNGRQEHNEAKRLNNKICEYLKPTGLKIHRGINNYKNNLLAGNTYTYKFGFSTHLNSAGATSTGIEMIVQPQEKYLELEEAILKRVSALTGLQNRGMKSRDYNTGSFIARKNGVAIPNTDYYKETRDARNRGLCLSIIETCFISNMNDMYVFDKYFDDIAFIIADEIAKYCNKTISKVPTSAPKPPTKYTTGLYKVNTDVLNIRAGAGTGYKVTGTVKNGDVYTITEIKTANSYTWGRLKSGSGWIALEYCIKR